MRAVKQAEKDFQIVLNPKYRICGQLGKIFFALERDWTYQQLMVGLGYRLRVGREIVHEKYGPGWPVWVAFDD